MLKLGKMRPPVRRVLALDTGSRTIKFLLAESEFGRVRVLKQDLLDLQQEGLVSADEIKTHLQASLNELGSPPLAIVLPQHLSTSQVVDLPLAPESEVEKLIHDETVKLSGVSESRIIYDFVRTDSQAKNRQQFWVTLAQERDIRERILRLGIEQEDICEVTTTANALISAYHMVAPKSSRAVLVHMGAQTTVLVIFLDGQGAYATSFQMGGDFLTRSLARQQNLSEQKAESLKRQSDLLNGTDKIPEFAAVVDGWLAELRGQLNEWLDHNRQSAASLESFDFIASGGGFAQPGLLDYLRTRAGFDLKQWPKSKASESISVSPGFEVALGAALQALGHSTQPVSLLPDDYRASWQKRLNTQKLEFVSLVFVLFCILALALGTWHKLSIINRQQVLSHEVGEGQKAVDANDALSADLVTEYEGWRPLFAAQQNTTDMLRTFALLQSSRSNRSMWYVLLADQQSYFSLSPNPPGTNKPLHTNVVGIVSSGSTATNISLARPGLIAELSIPEEAETARRQLSEIVNGLKQQPLFSKVDLLSEDLRRNVADPKVIVSDRDFVLAMDFAATDYSQPVRSRKSMPVGPRPPRRSARQTSAISEENDKTSGAAP
jgi:Tfp pilus assembly PilM family ATPase